MTEERVRGDRSGPTGEGRICPRQGCTRAVERHRFACPADWYALPLEIRQEVDRAYRAVRKAMGAPGRPGATEAVQAYADARQRAYEAWARP